MTKRQLSPSRELVKKSNALARARWSAESVWEPRLVALLASKVRPEDTDFQVYEIHVSELLQKAHSGRDYQEIETIVDKVMSRVLTIRDENGWTKYNVFSRCRFRRNEGMLELGFHPDLKPHYLQLQKNFVKYNLMEFLLLPSIYSQRLFEFLKSWSSELEHIEQMGELFEMLDVPQSLRKDFRNFRLRVLEKAHADIHKHTALRYDWEPVKTGRKVTAIRFVFKKGRPHKPTPALPKTEQPASTAPANTKLIDSVMRCWNENKGKCSGDLQAEEVCALCRQLHRHTSKHQQASLLD